tara:strand:+ start:2976 stop:3536 length:561 start_codon:yes stop_codon:yes gene_type:complete
MPSTSRHPATLFAAIAILLSSSLRLEAADWYTVQSDDKKISVLFPHKAEQFEVVTSSSPAGKVETQVAKHQEDGILLTVSSTQLPGLAVAFAGSKVILENAANGVLSKAYGKEVSSKSTEIGGAPALVLRYEAADFQNASHGGYQGLAIIIMIDKKLYTINTMLSKENSETKAMQDRLLNSIKVTK